MKTYTITVNGTAYDVTVEEGNGSRCSGSRSESSTEGCSQGCSRKGSSSRRLPQVAGSGKSNRFCSG